MQDYSGLDASLDDTFDDHDYNGEEDNQVESEDDSDMDIELGMQNNGKSPKKKAHRRKKLCNIDNSPRPKSPEKQAHGSKKQSHLDNSPRPKSPEIEAHGSKKQSHLDNSPRPKNDSEEKSENAPQKQQNRNLECRSSISKDSERDIFVESQDEGTQNQGEISDSTLDASSDKLFATEMNNLEDADDGDISDERGIEYIGNAEDVKMLQQENVEKNSDDDEEEEESDSGEEEEESDSAEEEEETDETALMLALREYEDEYNNKVPHNYRKLFTGFAEKAKQKVQNFAKCSNKRLKQAEAVKRKRGNC